MRRIKRIIPIILILILSFICFACKNEVEKTFTFDFSVSNVEGVEEGTYQIVYNISELEHFKTECGLTITVSVEDKYNNKIDVTSDLTFEVVADNEYTVTIKADYNDGTANSVTRTYNVKAVSSSQTTKKEIIWKLDNFTTIKEEMVNVNSKLTKPSDPVKDGFTFDYWYKDTDNSIPYNFSDAIKNNMTLTAKWLPIEHCFEFNSNGGTAVDSIKTDLTKGNLITRPVDPVRGGYVFKWWYQNDENTAFDFSATIITDLNTPQTFTLTAKWELLEYTATFITGSNDVTVSPIHTDLLAGYKFTEPVKPIKSGYTFNHWYLSDESKPFDFNNTIISSNITLHALWTVKAVTVTFDSKGGSSVNCIFTDILKQYKITLPEAVPYKEGYTFKHWYISEQNPDVAFVNDTVVTEDVTVFAAYNVINHTVLFETNNGTTIESQITNKDLGNLAYDPGDLTKTEYIFDNWYIKETNEVYEFNRPVISNPDVASTVTLIAKYIPIQHIIRFLYQPKKV
jgi:uncharacterized repeat protein (TIGR02543 family)